MVEYQESTIAMRKKGDTSGHTCVYVCIHAALDQVKIDARKY